jgi:hypothetical protein
MRCIRVSVIAVAAALLVCGGLATASTRADVHQSGDTVVFDDQGPAGAP